MRFLEMGLAFAAIGFVVADAALSLLTVLLWCAVRPSRLGAGSLFVLRMAPTIGSAAIVLGLVVPAFWAFEPRATSERAGPALAVCVLVACVLVVAGLYRAIASVLETRRLERLWRSAALCSANLEIAVPAYRVASEMPFAALVGVIRPRLFVSDRFFDALAPGERRTVVDHEAGHLLSFDNLKRLAMKVAPDWLAFSPVGREIETAWASAAEDDADDHAAGPDRSHSLDLAGALLKAARRTPLSCAAVSNFCEGARIARRVARLLDDSPRPRVPKRPWVRRYAWAMALLGAGALLSGPALGAAYAITEAAIRLLQ